VSGRGWTVATLRDVPSATRLPGGPSVEEYLAGMQERAPHILERWADA